MNKIILLLEVVLLMGCSSSYIQIGDSKENVKKKIGNPTIEYIYNNDFETWIYVSEPYNKYYYFNKEDKLVEMK